MPQIRCPVLGCGKRKDEWGGRKDGYPLPSPRRLHSPPLSQRHHRHQHPHLHKLLQHPSATQRRSPRPHAHHTPSSAQPPSRPPRGGDIFTRSTLRCSLPPPPSLHHLLRRSRFLRLRLLLFHLPPPLLAPSPTSPTPLEDSAAMIHRSSASASWRKQRLHSTLLCTSPSPSPSSSSLVLTSPPLPYSFPSSTICRLSSVVHTPLCPAALPGRHQRHGCRGRSALAAEQVHHLGHVIFLPSYTASSMVSHCVQIARTSVSDPWVTLE